MPILYLFGGFIILLIIGNLSKKSASHPLNAITAKKTGAPATIPTAGDSFCTGGTTVAGVCEPTKSASASLCVPITASFPICSPPPVAVQSNPSAAATKPGNPLPTIGSQSSGGVYVIYNGKAYAVNHAPTSVIPAFVFVGGVLPPGYSYNYVTWYASESAFPFPIANGQSVQYAPGTFIRLVNTPTVYQVQKNYVLRSVANPATFTELGGNWCNVQVVPSLAPFKVGNPLPAYVAPAAAAAPPTVKAVATPAKVVAPTAPVKKKVLSFL